MSPMSQHVSGPERAETDPRGQSGRARGLSRDGRNILLRTVEQDVIPRLVSMPWMDIAPAFPKAQAAAAAFVSDETTGPALDDAAVSRLLMLCLEPDGRAVAAYVAELSGQGARADRIYADLLTPVARRLGELWENDECSFADVTIALMRLQNAQRALASEFDAAVQTRLDAPRVLLLPVPGEQHTFGLSMVMDFFRRAGWDAWLGTMATDSDAIELVRRERADMVGLSFAVDDRIETAARLIANFRIVAGNPALKVIVGGPAFVADPLLAARLGADGTALDGHQAVLLAHDLLHATAERT